MAWRLARWKDCDGGCCVRAPRFPRNPANRGMSDCIFHENGPGGTDPSSAAWRGGCRVMKAMNALIASKGGNLRSIRANEIEDLSEIAQALATQEPPHGDWSKRSLQWFLDTCWGWPTRTAGTLIEQFLTRAKELGLWDDVTYSSGIEDGLIYTDEQREELAQEFHVTSDMTQSEKEDNEPACCYYWEQI